MFPSGTQESAFLGAFVFSRDENRSDGPGSNCLAADKVYGAERRSQSLREHKSYHQNVQKPAN